MTQDKTNGARLDTVAPTGKRLPTTAVVIVAAGRGRRLGGEVPKQYQKLGKHTVLRHTVARFLALPFIDHLQVVIHPDDRDQYDVALADVADPRVLPAVPGGATRAQTTFAGLRALSRHGPDYVLIHDAARPFVSSQVITRVIDELEHTQGAFAGLPVVDALWRTENGQARDPVERLDLWRAQTPQGFHFGPILRAHDVADAEAADDVAVARAAGMEVRAVMGAEENYKLTLAEDMTRAKGWEPIPSETPSGPKVTP